MQRTKANVSAYKVVPGKSNDTIIPDLEKAYSFCRWKGTRAESLKALFPRRGGTVEFNLRNTWICIANGYRRIMIDEVEHPHFDTGYNLIETDDDYCNALRLYIRDRVNAIPISYVPKPNGESDDEEDDTDSCQFVLEARSTQEGRMVVTSDMIRPVNKAAQSVKWAEHVDIIYIGAGKHLTVNITMRWGVNRQLATYSHFGPVVMRSLGHELPARLAPGELPSLLPSWNTIPQAFYLRFKYEWFDDPWHTCMLGWNTMIEKLERTQRYVDEFVDGDSKLPHHTDYMTVIQRRDGLVRYEFHGETQTLGCILDWYVFMIDTSIPNVRSDDDHAEDNSILLLINHVDHSTLLQKAVGHALEHVRDIVKQFNGLKR